MQEHTVDIKYLDSIFLKYSSKSISFSEMDELLLISKNFAFNSIINIWYGYSGILTCKIWT